MAPHGRLKVTLGKDPPQDPLRFRGQASLFFARPRCLGVCYHSGAQKASFFSSVTDEEVDMDRSHERPGRGARDSSQKQAFPGAAAHPGPEGPRAAAGRMRRESPLLSVASPTPHPVSFISFRVACFQFF